MSCPFQIGQVVCDIHNPNLKVTRVGWISQDRGVFILNENPSFGSVVLELKGLCENMSHLPEIANDQ